MVCQSCGKRNATVCIKNIVNGEMSEGFLCSACAAQMGYAVGANRSVDFQKMLQNVLNNRTETPAFKEQKCPNCGCTFSEISQAGKLGCSVCYETFESRLQPTIQHLYGESHHVGRIPLSASKKAKLEEEIEADRKALAKAIDEEDFEQAVVLRDKIRRAEAARNQR